MEHFRNPRNVGEIPDADGVGNVGNPVCVPDSTLINCNSSVAEIKDIKKGTAVLSHDGKYHTVSRIFRRLYKNPLMNIKVHNLGGVTLTPEHHVLALKTNHLRHKFYESKKYVADWYMAAELKKGDVILYPIPKEEAHLRSIKFDQPKLKHDFKSKDLPKELVITEDFLRLIGYYLAEGYVRTDKCKGTLGFVFGATERRLADDVISTVKKEIGLDIGNTRVIRNAINIEFYSARLARFFEKFFGKGAANKKMPHSFVLLSPEKQKSIICGLWRGDGYINKKGAKYVTISKQLAYQLRLLLLRQKIIFSFLKIEAKGMHKENYCIYVKEENSLKKLGQILGVSVNRPPKLRNTHKCWHDENFFYFTIKKIDRLIYKGLIYNLEVEDAHSYVGEALTLHNCGDIMRLYIKVDENEVITDAKFKTFGCGAAIATSSMVTELVKGKTIKEALSVSNRAVAEALGGLPKIKMHCSVLAEQALKSAIDDYLARKKKE
ncbi:MAG: iron-sulfur cluster assembly scaffold protein [Candidatus Omnitrophica bacterium]|nr:iron-sulfur cluster assembly scaffold protein [Candidatus Omnitrophota bacterium]